MPLTAIKKMPRYLKLYLNFIKVSLIREGQYRFNFFLSVLMNFLWGLIYLLLYKFIFGYIQNVGDWNYESLLILAATFLVVNALVKVFFEINFIKFATTIYYGDLDLILLKPVSSQFYVSLREFSFRTFLRFLMGCLVLTAVMLSTKIPINFINILIFIILILLSVILVYALWFLSLNIVFYAGNIENIYELFHPFLRFTVTPLDVLPRPVKELFFFVVPLFFVTTVPVKALMGLISWPAIGWGFFITGLLLYLSHKIWQMNLKRYSSASS